MRFLISNLIFFIICHTVRLSYAKASALPSAQCLLLSNCSDFEPRQSTLNNSSDITDVPHLGKRNTSRAVFTYHERAIAKSSWSSKSARLNRDSYLPFGSCSLCLEIARDPVACPLGDIFCRECALANLLAQKRDLKRAEKARRQASQEDARAQLAKDNEDYQWAVRDFELVQAGLTASRKTVTFDSVTPGENGASHAARKRKFKLDEEGPAEDKATARMAIDSEKVSLSPLSYLLILFSQQRAESQSSQAGKPILPSFWTPSLTPDVKDRNLRSTILEVKAVPICPSSIEGSPHAISMQRLVTIQFQEDADKSKSSKRRSCPSCLKALTNSSSPVMVQQCGHVMCLKCVKRFLIPSKAEAVSGSPNTGPPIACYVCDSPILGKSVTQRPSVISLPVGLVLLKSEGTGFSARGCNTVEKSGVGFQC